MVDNVMFRKTARTVARKPRRILNFEALEPRAMMSASTASTVNSPLVAPPAGPTFSPLVTVAPISAVTAPTTTGPFDPAQIRKIYGFDKLSLDGAGTTIAIVDAYDDPSIAQDLHAFDQEFGLTDPTLTIHKQSGNDNTFNKGWAQEVSLDVEWAHAIAPGANILLCEASSDSGSDMFNTINYARNAPGVSVVSISFGVPEFEQSWNPGSWGDANQTDYDSSLFVTPQGHRPVSFVVAAGDTGSVVTYPSTSPNVLAVGGTVITAFELAATSPSPTPSNFQQMSYDSEAAWSHGGGGFSGVESRPAYQNGFNSNSMRSTPDVAYSASGFWIFDSNDGGWEIAGGTSAGAPQWSALIALANEQRAQLGGDTLSNTVADIYQLPSTDFHDITTGSTGYYKATVGFDQTTGRGTPIANLLVNDLARSELLPPPANPTPIGVFTGWVPPLTVNMDVIVSTPPTTTTTTTPKTTSTAMKPSVANVVATPLVSRIAHGVGPTMLHASDAADELLETMFGLEGRLQQL
jgi:subtilase family serine protease